MFTRSNGTIENRGVRGSKCIPTETSTTSTTTTTMHKSGRTIIIIIIIVLYYYIACVLYIDRYNVTKSPLYIIIIILHLAGLPIIIIPIYVPIIYVHSILDSDIIGLGCVVYTRVQ